MVARGLKGRFRLKRLHILMGVCALALMLAGSMVELFIAELKANVSLGKIIAFSVVTYVVRNNFL